MSEITRPVYDDADDVIMEAPATPGCLEDIRKKLALDFTQPTISESKPIYAPGQEHMKVYLRVRPFMEQELENNENQKTIHQDSDNTLTVHAPKDSVTFKNTAHGCGKQTHHFTFSKIFDDNVQQRGFFEETMLGTVKDFVDGQNCLMFTYGVTGSGKTYTILGKPNDSGILPRSLDVVFNSIEGKQWSSMSLKPHMFCDVNKLSESQQDLEQKIKDKVLRMSADDDVDMTTMMGDEMSDVSRSVINTTSVSMGSLNSTTGTRESSADSLIAPADNTQAQIDKLFEEVEHRDREKAAINVEAQGQIKFSVWVSFAEIYNEYIYDLLDPIPKKKTARRGILKLASDRTGAPYIKGLKWIHVSSADEAYKVLSIGQKNLQTACTKLNQNSSRSHCIFTMKLLRVVDKENPRVARVSMLSFCDLAGSERYKKTQSTGERLREAGSINRSLLTLGQCIEMLRFNQTHKAYQKIVPFRESKLTRLFQNFFSGKGRASMIVNINQNASMFDETLHVLKFSAIAKQVTSVQKVEEKKPKKMMSVSMGPNGRASVAWATPGSLQRWIEEEEKEDTMQTVEEEDEDEDLFEEEDVEKNKMLDVISRLQEQREKDRMRMACMELDIREEVCNEMAQHIVKIEQDYSERMEEQKYQAEERADQKLKLYMASVKKSRKRARVEKVEEDNDEYVSSVILHQEKVKVQDLEKEKSSLQQQLTKTRFELAATKQQLEKGVTLEKSAFLNESVNDITNTELVEDLAQQLEDAKSKLAEQDQHILQLNDMLTEAGDMFEMKEIEIEKLKAVIHDDERRMESQNEIMEDLKHLAVDSKQAIEETEVKLKEQEDTIKRLEAEHAEQNIKVNKLRQTIDEQKQKTEKPEEALSITIMETKREDLENELFQEREDRSHVEEKMRSMEKKIACLESSLSSVRVAGSGGEFEAMVDKLKHELQGAKSQIDTADSMITELSQQVQKLEGAVELAEQELSTTRDENLDTERRISEVQETHAETEKKLSCELEARDVLQSRINVLEDDLKNAQEVLEEKKEIKVELNNLKTKFDLLQEEIKQENIEKANLLTKLEIFEEDFEQCDEKLTAEIDRNAELQIALDGVKVDLGAANERLAKEVNLKEELEQGFQKLKDCQEQTEGKLVSMESLLVKKGEESLNNLQQELLEVKDNAARLKLELAEAKNEIRCHKDMEKEFLQDKDTICGRVEVLETELQVAKDLNEQCLQLEQELAETKIEVDKMKVLKKKLKKTKIVAERVPTLEKELGDAHAEVARLQEQYDEAKEEVVRLAVFESELQQVKVEAERVPVLEKELEESSGEIVELETELKNASDNASRLESEMKDSRTELGHLKNVAQGLDIANKKIKSLEMELKDAQDKMVAVSQDLDDAASKKIKVVELEKELEGLRTDTRKVELMEVQLGDVKIKAYRVEQLEEQLLSAQVDNEKLKCLEEEMDKAQVQLKHYEKTKEELRSALSEVMKVEDDLETAEEELTKTKNLLEQQKDRVQSHEQEIRVLGMETEKAQKESVEVHSHEMSLVTEVRDLKATITSLESNKVEMHLKSIKVHESERENFVKECEKSNARVEELQARINELESSLEETDEELSRQSTNRERVEEQRSQIEGRLKKSQSRLEKAEMTVVDVIKHREKAEENVEKLKEKVEGLTEECSKLKHTVAEAKSLEQRVQELEMELDDQRSQLGSKICDKSSKVESLVEKVKQLEVAVEEQVTLKSNAEQRLCDLDTRLEELLSVKTTAEGRISELEATVEEQMLLKANAEQKVGELKATVEEQLSLTSNMEQKMHELEANAQEHGAVYSEVESTLVDLKCELQEQRMELSELAKNLKEKIAETEEYKSRIVDLEMDLKSEMSKTEGLETNLKEEEFLKQTLNEDVENMRVVASVMVEKVEDLEAKLNGQKVGNALKIEAYESEIEELQEEIKKLKDAQEVQKVDLVKSEESLKAKQDEVIDLRQTVRQLEMAQRKLESAKLELETTKTAVEEKVTELRCALDAERFKCENTQREVAVLVAKMTGLETSFEADEVLEADVTWAVQTITTLKQDLADANAYITEENSRLNSLEEKFNSRENDFVQKDASLQELSEKLKNEEKLLAQVELLESRLCAAEKAAATDKEEVAALREVASAQDAERLDQERALDELQAKKEELMESMENLTKENMTKIKKEASFEVDSLKQVLSEKDEVIQQLRKQNDSMVSTPRRTRGKGQQSTEDNLLHELKKLSDELEIGKEKRRVEKEKQDQIISDLKEMNRNLTSSMKTSYVKHEPLSFSPAERKGGIENIDPVASGIDLSSLDLPMSSFNCQTSMQLSPEQVKRKTRGRPRKSKKSESDETYEPTPTQSGRKSRRKPLSSSSRKNGSTSSSLSPSLSSLEFQSKPAPTTQKRKRRLYKDMDTLMEACSPAKMTPREVRLLSSGCHCDCHREMLATPCHRRCCKRCTNKKEEKEPTEPTSMRRTRTSTRV